MEHEIITAWAGVGIGVGQLLLIAWGLRQMGKASQERNRQLDAMEAAQREQGQALRDIGQALERQGEAMTQAFTQQGEALAELLRRPA